MTGLEHTKSDGLRGPSSPREPALRLLFLLLRARRCSSPLEEEEEEDEDEEDEPADAGSSTVISG
jgi:hypothetical protein